MTEIEKLRQEMVASMMQANKAMVSIVQAMRHESIKLNNAINEVDTLKLEVKLLRQELTEGHTKLNTTDYIKSLRSNK